MLSFDANHNGGILTITVALSAWLFKRRGLAICIFIMLTTLVAFHIRRLGTFMWPMSFVLSFYGGFLVLILGGFIIITLRNLLDTADEDRKRAQKAEQQTAIACEQQRQLDLIKHRFLLSVNHELRTPLASLYGSLQILETLLEQPEATARARQKKYLANALLSCNELRSLVQTVLDTLQASSGTDDITLKVLPLDQIVHETIERFDGLKEQQERIILTIPSHLLVQGNRQYIIHVIRNILSNAFKYTPPDTPVTINATFITGEKPEVRVSVKDMGQGIPPDEIPLLFKQFVRLERDVTGTVRGTGLGLYICKHLVEAMHGRIWVESTGVPGEGSCFFFTLPAAPQSLPHPPTPQ